MKLPSLEWSVSAATMPGETESGDKYWVRAGANNVRFAVIDGLGHGREAAAASTVAISTLEKHADAPIIEQIQLCHDSLRETRGVAMSLASLDTDRARLTWIGIGNVDALLLHKFGGRPHDKLLLRSGVVGAHLPTLRTAELQVSPGDLMIMLTDGVMSDRLCSISFDGQLSATSNAIMASAVKGSDDALVLVARYRGVVS
ncbi:MAG TPA: SpoIIE family protein phosphatase [Steroidobacteraceae bacterium]|nr:SpoIIE family protein phosphatase [Steroidobacteraceae bacterium]